MNLDRMTDADLLNRTLEARRAAHDAPLNPYRLDADGHRWVEQRSTAYATASGDWMALANEVDRRGLPQPRPTWDGDSRRKRKANPECYCQPTGDGFFVCPHCREE
jgi:hypothetical protein